jgi:hypothetical protein
MPMCKKETSIMYNAPLTICTVEIEYAFLHALIGKLPLLINFIVKVVISSQLYAEERARQQLRIRCVTVLIRLRKQDGCINIVTRSQACHVVRYALNLINLKL